MHRRQLALLALTAALLTPALAAQTQEAKLLAPDAMSGDYFGRVAVSGDVAVVGAPKDSRLGAVYVFRRSKAGWAFEQSMTEPSASNLDDRFGAAVAVDGNTLVAGCPHDHEGGGAAGAAFVFVWDGTSWQLEAKLIAADAEDGDQLGGSVGISGDRVVAGARYEDERGDNAGAAYVFERSGSLWSQSAKLVAADGAAGDDFGMQVAISVGILAVSAPLNDDHGFDSGSCYIFTDTGGTWNQEVKLLSADGSVNDLFGQRIDVLPGRCVASSLGDDHAGPFSGSAYVFERTETSWIQAAKLTASDAGANERFGSNVATYGDRILVGAASAVGPVVGSGACYSYKRTDTGWTSAGKFWPLDGELADEFGFSVDIDRTTILIGAQFDDDSGGAAGSAYVFTLPPEPSDTLCPGDSSSTPCPCGNDSATTDTGCLHSGGIGMRIAVLGAPSVSRDSMSMTASDCPHGNSGIFYCGTTSLDPGQVLYDGLQCAGGDVRRFRGVFQFAGTVSDTGFVGQDPSGVYFQAGLIYFFQYWSRDVAAGPSPCGTGANLSPGYAVTMEP